MIIKLIIECRKTHIDTHTLIPFSIICVRVNLSLSDFVYGNAGNSICTTTTTTTTVANILARFSDLSTNKERKRVKMSLTLMKLKRVKSVKKSKAQTKEEG